MGPNQSIEIKRVETGEIVEIVSVYAIVMQVAEKMVGSKSG
jgi:hypothetical protein